jgi:hypothetical protein
VAFTSSPAQDAREITFIIMVAPTNDKKDKKDDDKPIKNLSEEDVRIMQVSAAQP